MSSLTFLGDVYLDRPFVIKKELENFIFNLEFPISDKGEPIQNKVNLKQEKSFIQQTFGKRPLGVALANNHIFDYGETAFEDTLSFLKQKEIPYFGAGTTDKNFNNPLQVTIAGKKVCLFNYCGMEAGPAINVSDKYNIALIDPDRIKKDLEAYTEPGVIRICVLHWGEEEINMPSPAEIELAHKIIDSGADMIIGHHPHVIKPLEIYKEKPVFYSLGNFIFPDLNLKTFWNGERFTRSIRKKQNLSNRNSLIVEYDVLTRQYKLYKALQNSNQISVSETHLPDQSAFLNSPDYGTYFQKYYRKQRRKILLNAFLNNPRLPKAGSIKELIRSLKS